MGVYESKIQQDLAALKMDALDFAQLSGVNRTTLSLAFRGGHQFASPEMTRLQNLVRELQALAEDALPYELSWKNWDNVKLLLSLRRDGIRVVSQFLEKPI